MSQEDREHPVVGDREAIQVPLPVCVDERPSVLDAGVLSAA
jgi:hypothetical protein